MNDMEKARLTINRDDALVNLKLLNKHILDVEMILTELKNERENQKFTYEQLDRRLAFVDHRFKVISKGKSAEVATKKRLKSNLEKLSPEKIKKLIALLEDES